MIDRYQVIKAIIKVGKEIIPIGDSRIEYIKDDYFGNHVIIKDDGFFQKYHEFSEAILDLKTKTLSLGQEIEYKPESSEFFVNQEVMFEVSHRKLSKAKIVSIIYENFEINVSKGKKIAEYYRKYFKDLKIEDNSLYCMKVYTPSYVLDSGTVIHYEHQLYLIS